MKLPIASRTGSVSLICTVVELGHDFLFMINLNCRTEASEWSQAQKAIPEMFGARGLPVVRKTGVGDLPLDPLPWPSETAAMMIMRL